MTTSKTCIACGLRPQAYDPDADDHWQYCEHCLEIRRAQLTRAGYLEAAIPNTDGTHGNRPHVGAHGHAWQTTHTTRLHNWSAGLEQLRRVAGELVT